MDNSLMTLMRSVPLFRNLDTRQIEMLAQHTRRKSFRPHEALFHEGDEEQTTLYIIVSGHINIQLVTSSGKIVHIARRGPGECVGDLSLIDGKPRMADAVTATSCELLLLRRAEFIQCIEASPALAMNIMSTLAERIRQAANHLISYQELDVLGRVSEVLLALVGEEYRGSASPSHATVLRVPQQVLAEQVGTSRESVSRALASLESARAIRKDGRQIVITNLTKLRQCCDK